MALVEFIYPETFLNITTINNGNVVKIDFRNYEKDKDGNDIRFDIKLEPGLYKTNELLHAINKWHALTGVLSFSLEKGEERSFVKVKSERIKHLMKYEDISDEEVQRSKSKAELRDRLNVVSVKLSPLISLQLGYDVDIDFMTSDSIKAKRPPLPEAVLPSQIFIYCDLISLQHVGDARVQLLRNVHVPKHNYKFGSQRAVIFDSPHYLPVEKNEFQSIHIDLRDDTGSPLPFEFGTSSVKLHFRRAE